MSEHREAAPPAEGLGPTISEPRWRIFLDVLFGIATFIGLVGCLVLWSDGRAFNATACVLITLVAVGIWLAGLRNRSTPGSPGRSPAVPGCCWCSPTDRSSC